MVPSILLALLNGVLIATSRSLNGRLSGRVGPIRASLWNHGVGFVLLSVLVAASYADQDVSLRSPAYMWLGGVLGVAFVALNSHAVTRLGASRTASLVVGAQMLASVLIDSLGSPISNATFVGLGGAVLIILGVRRAHPPAQKRPPLDRGAAEKI